MTPGEQKIEAQRDELLAQLQGEFVASNDQISFVIGVLENVSEKKLDPESRALMETLLFSAPDYFTLEDLRTVILNTEPSTPKQLEPMLKGIERMLGRS